MSWEQTDQNRNATAIRMMISVPIPIVMGLPTALLR